MIIVLAVSINKLAKNKMVNKLCLCWWTTSQRHTASWTSWMDGA